MVSVTLGLILVVTRPLGVRVPEPKVEDVGVVKMVGVLTETAPVLFPETVDTKSIMTPITGDTDTEVTNEVKVQSLVSLVLVD